MNLKELNRQERFDYLRANEKALKAEKMASIKHTTGYSSYSECKITSEKAAGEDDADNLTIDIAANTCMYIDDQYDALAVGGATKSINENLGRGMIYFLKNHGRRTDDIVGDVLDASYKRLKLSDFNIQSEKDIDVLVVKGCARRRRDEKTFNLYKDRMIKQHSIGIQYVKLQLAINDPTDTEHYKTWTATYDQIVNKEVADELGFYWYVTEFKFYEVSAVLWGSNDLTPVIEPSKDTQPDSRKESTITKEELQELLNKQLTWTKKN